VGFPDESVEKNLNFADERGADRCFKNGGQIGRSSNRLRK
jgi:hypothetical protein